uniref:Light-regulated protein n=1 Tax=Rhizophora mucronata TaxID=61149 RepID=A0A2P2KV06_RHIMU
MYYVHVHLLIDSPLILPLAECSSKIITSLCTENRLWIIVLEIVSVNSSIHSDSSCFISRFGFELCFRVYVCQASFSPDCLTCFCWKYTEETLCFSDKSYTKIAKSGKA